ncbi:FAD-dependent oxidoreductase [Methanosphaerula subterraneus]|uniref:FAD-dependent oxidoreductase n=1 Tax=Methanosphaerula subterraneus TaxID=3350244 RepID=UPI003F85734A
MAMMITVVGGGPAGRIAAMHLASAGEEVRLIERGRLGGQCLHSGCMLVCALNDVARIIRSAKGLEEMGVVNNAPQVQIPGIFEGIAQVQRTIEHVLDNETAAAGVTVLTGEVTAIDGLQVTLDGTVLDSDAVIIATGSRPLIPDIPGIATPGVYTPQTVMQMETLPEKLVIIGGGISAAEMAYIFAAFGSEVHLCARTSLLKSLHPHLAAEARKELAGVHIHEQTAFVSVNGGDRVRSVTVKDGPDEYDIPADAVLITAGLLPNTDLVTGVLKHADGTIIVDDHMRTSNPSVYACGDVNGRSNLTPVARREGIVAAENILGRDATMGYHTIPHSLALGYELAWIGDLEEGQQRYRIPGPAGPGSFWSVPRRTTGFAEVQVRPDDGAITGIWTAAPSGAAIAAYAAQLIRSGQKVDDFGQFIEVHPVADGVYGLLKYAAAQRSRH